MTRTACGEQHYSETLLAIAGFGLHDAERAFPGQALDDTCWLELLACARTHRVLGLLRAAIDGGMLPVTAQQTRQAAMAHRPVAARVLALEHELGSLADLLGGAGIEMRVLKGPAFARLDWASPALRSFIDLDILIRPRDIDRAVSTLLCAGFTRSLAQPRPGFDRRFDKGVTMCGPTNYELDLHRTFVLGPWGVRVELDELWDGGADFAVGDRTMRALAQPNRFLHACYHAALGNWPLRLGSLRDIAEMLPTAETVPDLIRDRASGWGVEAVVATAVVDTVRLLRLSGSGELAKWAARYVPTRKEERWLALHTHSGKTFTAQALATVAALPRLRDKAAYVRALSFPDARYTADRHASARARFRFAIVEARRGRAGRD